ncbi:hypothetical protein KSP39_PZI024445 [Platanthera zijinensis]|uniref:Uncharacterized protein n=1 Tax=Platanthera zijinensis TaxID=2320716 RepID=A0AAP0AT16_9ASPA
MGRLRPPILWRPRSGPPPQGSAKAVRSRAASLWPTYARADQGNSFSDGLAMTSPREGWPTSGGLTAAAPARFG